MTNRERRLIKLLAQAREWLNGCRGANAPNEDEECECSECGSATTLLFAIDDELEGLNDDA